MASTLRSFASLDARGRPTVGDTKTNAITTDHMGWLYCDGRALNTSDYVQLFNVIGYQFGGSGSSFNLPAPQGRVPGFVGQADGPGPDTLWKLGDISGEETHLLLLSEVPAHNHDISGGALDVSNGVVPTNNGNTSVNGLHSHTGKTVEVVDTIESETVTKDGIGGTAVVSGSNPRQLTLTIDSSGNHSHQIASNGGSQRHNNIQPTIWIGNLFIYGGRQWVAATPQSRAIQGAYPVKNSNRYRTQGPGINLY